MFTVIINSKSFFKKIKHLNDPDTDVVVDITPDFKKYVLNQSEVK